MAKRQVVLTVDPAVCLTVETEFSADELSEAADAIQDELMLTEDGWNDEKVIDGLVKRGYITIVSKGPEVIELLY